MKPALLLFSVLLCTAACAEEAHVAATEAQQETVKEAAEAIEPARYTYEIVQAYPHDSGAFTQGLVWHDGHLLEGTGRNGESTIRKVDLASGEVLKSHSLPDEYFGEGIVEWDGRIIGLTWRSGKGFVVDAETFEQVGEFSYEGEGWGLTHDGSRLIMSDGTDRLRFFDPETLEETGSVAVTFKGEPLIRLNELEWIDGEVWANVWQTNAIVRIDPGSGAVTGVIDMSGLSDVAGIGASSNFVLNGIAHDDADDRIFVTGKYWPALFEVWIVPVKG